MSNRNPNHYRLRASTEARDENTPVGHVNRTGYGSGTTGRAVMALLANESPLMVVMASSGEVFALDPIGLRATATATQHPEWIVGTYTDRCGTGTIAGDLREGAKALRSEAA